jgi:hypothetical protein
MGWLKTFYALNIFCYIYLVNLRTETILSILSNSSSSTIVLYCLTHYFNAGGIKASISFLIDR